MSEKTLRILSECTAPLAGKSRHMMLVSDPEDGSVELVIDHLVCLIIDKNGLHPYRWGIHDGGGIARDSGYRIKINLEG